MQARLGGGGRVLGARGAAWGRGESTTWDGGREESESERFMMSLEERGMVRRRRRRRRRFNGGE